jgi:hypothetical protein
VRIEFDSAKKERNIRERSLSFTRVVEFDFETAAYAVDNRRDYSEARSAPWGIWMGVCMRWFL